MWSCFAIATILLISLLKFSTYPCALGWYGVTGLWMKPVSVASWLNSWELNGGPLSVCTTFGTPCVANIFFNLSRTGVIAIERVNSTSG